jgi:hypothetical protein
VIPPALLYLFRIALAIQDLLCLHMNFRIFKIILWKMFLKFCWELHWICRSSSVMWLFSRNYFNLLYFSYLFYDLKFGVLENVPWAAEKNVYSISIGWKILHMSDKSTWSMVQFDTKVSLLILYLDDLFIYESGILKSPIVVISEPIPLCAVVHFYEIGYTNI